MTARFRHDALLHSVAAAAPAVLPFLVIGKYGTDGFAQFAELFSVYALALFLGPIGFDLSLARSAFSYKRSALLLAASSALAALLLATALSHQMSRGEVALICLAAAAGVANGFLTNRIYFAGGDSIIRRSAGQRLGVSIAAAAAVLVTPEPRTAFLWLASQNALCCCLALFLAREVRRTNSGSGGDSFNLPAVLRSNIASFLVFSFPGLLQALERFLVVQLPGSLPKDYLVFITTCSLLTYVGTGIERSLYGNSDAPAAQKTAAGLFAFSMIVTIGLTAVFAASTGIFFASPVTTLLILLTPISLLISAHIAFFFSAAPTVYRQFSFAALETTALNNFLCFLFFAGVSATLTALLHRRLELHAVATGTWLAISAASFIRYRLAARLSGSIT